MGENLLTGTNGVLYLDGFRLGNFTEIAEFEDEKESDEETEKNVINNDFSFNGSFTFELTKKSIKKLEKHLVYGWRNKMPLRKRLVKRMIFKRFKAYLIKEEDLIDELY